MYFTNACTGFSSILNDAHWEKFGVVVFLSWILYYCVRWSISVNRKRASKFHWPYWQCAFSLKRCIILKGYQYNWKRGKKITLKFYLGKKCLYSGIMICMYFCRCEYYAWECCKIDFRWFFPSFFKLDQLINLDN